MADARGYDDLIMEHIRNARGYRVLADATHRARGRNPLCGDEMTVYVRLDGARVAAIAYQCSCCGIAMASASIMSELLHAQPLATVTASLHPWTDALVRHAEPPDAAVDPLRHALLKTVRTLPARTSCAALPWATLAAALADRSETVNVEVRPAAAAGAEPR